jgi:hypothetical protein
MIIFSEAWTFLTEAKNTAALTFLLAFSTALIVAIWKFITRDKKSPIATQASTENKSVVIQGSKGSPVSHTGKGDIIVGISFEQYKHDRKEREAEITKELKLAHEEERKVLLIEKADIELQLTNSQASYQQYIDNLKERIKQLEEKDKQIPDHYFKKAKKALLKGKHKKAGEIFAQVEQDTNGAIHAAAEAAYQRSMIARDNIRYKMR